jgi:Transcription factor Iwr1
MNEKEDDDEMSEEDEDSNDENNWRNDYPDEDEFSDEDGSIGERQMRKAVANFDIEDELSSDDDNDFVYSVDSESANFEDDVDFSAGNRLGREYAKYKKRNMKLLQSNYEDNNADKEEEEEDDLFHSD